MYINLPLICPIRPGGRRGQPGRCRCYRRRPPAVVCGMPRRCAALPAHDHQCQWGPVLLASRTPSCVLMPLPAWPTWPCASQLQALPYTVLLRFVPAIDAHSATCAQLFALLCQLVKQQQQPVALSSQHSCMCCPHAEHADGRCCCSCCACCTGTAA